MKKVHSAMRANAQANTGNAQSNAVAGQAQLRPFISNQPVISIKQSGFKARASAYSTNATPTLAASSFENQSHNVQGELRKVLGEGAERAALATLKPGSKAQELGTSSGHKPDDRNADEAGEGRRFLTERQLLGLTQQPRSR